MTSKKAAANPAAYLRCHCEQLIVNDAQGTRGLRDHFRKMDAMTGAAARIRELEAALADRVAERLAEADAVLERLGVTWSGKAYVGMAREKEEC